MQVARGSPRSFVLDVRPNELEAFSSLHSVLNQIEGLLAPRSETELRNELQRVQSYLADAGLTGSQRLDETGRTKFLADSVTFAVMRRISRESVHTSRIIDLSARFLNGTFARCSSGSEIHVFNLDELDRPTLKVLGRAVLLLRPIDDFKWVWHTSCDPTMIPSPVASLYQFSRRLLLHHLYCLTHPNIVRHGVVYERVPEPFARTDSRTLADVSVELVSQNYDACFLLTRGLIAGSDPLAASEGLRLCALAAINVGSDKRAMGMLREAELSARDAARKAHFAYLQGLIEAKRRYDPAVSDSHFHRGLASLNASGNHVALSGETEDLPLERAWLFNGLALNQAIRWRRNRDRTKHFERAVKLIQEAFQLAKTGDTPARTYLRFNLLANLAFLMEMCGHFDRAIEVFERTFPMNEFQTGVLRLRARVTTAYRIGVLQSKSGRLSEAFGSLLEAENAVLDLEDVALRERVRRALGQVGLQIGNFVEAERAFQCGLDDCLEGRLAEGSVEHGRGLVATLVATNRKEAAWCVVNRLLLDEGLQINGSDMDGDSLQSLLPSPPSPKLPAYIPEIDLEEIPPIDMNRFLVGALKEGTEDARIWRS